MKVAITIRPAKASDAAEMLLFLAQMGKETDMLMTGPEGPRFTLEQEEDFLGKTESAERSIFLVAEQGGKIIGSCQLSANERERIAHWGSLGITVLKNYWRQGIASQLMEGVLGFAKKIGLHAVTLEVRTDNGPAIALYEKFGFKIWGTFKDFMRVKGQFYDGHYMSLYLD